MAELSPIERVTRFFNREPVDTMPFFTGMGMVLAPAIKKLGYNFPSIHRESAEKLAWAGIESARMFNLDSIVIPFDMCWESEALGNKISLYEESEDILYPTIPEKNWTELDQVEITKEQIDTIMDQFPMTLIPEAIKICKKEAPELPVGAWQLGPFTQCGQTIELDKVLKGVFKQKDKVAEILDSFTDSAGFKPGSDYTVFDGAGIPFSVVICWEGTYPYFIRRFVVNGAQFVINISNDMWTRTRAGHFQHFSMTKFRAIENRIWFARAANDGVTAFINPHGEVIKILPIKEEGYLVGEVGGRVRETFYTRYGDILPKTGLFVLGLSFIGALLILIGQERKNRKVR